MQVRRRVAQIIRQSVDQRSLVRTGNRQLSCGTTPGAVARSRDPAEAEEAPEEIASAPEHARRERRRIRKIEEDHDVDQRLKLVGVTVRGKGPDILHREVRRDLVDAPGARSECCVRNPHREPFSPRAQR
jgi:hypothetical protein